ERVKWDDCRDFFQKINDKIKGLDLELPSESQWEYACRAGSETAIYTGPLIIEGENNAPALDAIAWYGGNSGRDFELEEGADASGWSDKQYEFDKAGTHPVKGLAPNDWGLYDMLGNVWEWTADAWHNDYEGAPEDGAAWEGDSGAGRVVRGGSWGGGARVCRSACRSVDHPDVRFISLGFRPARVQS
ncbi:MAG: formylglycine-generating enzyme family protein, partial [Gammaproteobacteria bacterium]|nr:formylglycine-generating enzyme family protein [Gammaproteobacteria bacterium]